MGGFGSKLVTAFIAVIGVIALVDILKNPAGTNAAGNQAQGLLKTSYNAALGQPS